jgi:ankyrin repeat protein
MHKKIIILSTFILLLMVQSVIASNIHKTPNQLGNRTYNNLMHSVVFNSEVIVSSDIDIKMLGEAFKRGANPNYVSDDGKVAFLQVIDLRNLDAVNLFIQNGADVNMFYYNEKDYYSNSHTPLTDAILKGDFQIVKALVEAGADVNVKVPSKCKVYTLEDEWTPMFFLISQDMENPEHLNIFKYLISKGADISVTDKGGNNLLMICAKRGNYLLAKMYIDMGFNLSARNNEGKTALDLAIENGDKKIINILLSAIK